MIEVRLQPRAATDEIAGERDGVLLVRVRAAPERGRANEALLRLIAGRLKLPLGRVELARGARSRQKLVRVSGLDEDAVRDRLGMSQPAPPPDRRPAGRGAGKDAPGPGGPTGSRARTRP
ncbi:MAG TPA: DUF167 domain-containing protein [Solirubrobacteraceae bacterium]|nr:DUF167 domain-containing protein [Solirubrobacteraceae bacterium]